MKPGAILARLILIMIGSLLVVSCGRKTAPIPPQAAIPAPISGLKHQLDEKGVSLFWEKPLRTEQGKKLARIDSFIVEKAEYPIDEFCQGCPARYFQLASIPSSEEGIKLSYRDEGLRPGHVYLYRVLTRMGWQVESLPSRPIVFTWQQPVEAVSGLHAERGDQQIVLSWQEPTRSIDSSPVAESLNYEVFRSVDGKNFTEIAESVKGPFYKDERLTNGIEYRYKVKAVRLSGGTGVFSSSVVATPVDLTPPPTPQNLNAVIGPEGTRIFWEPVIASDLAGYQLFRQTEGEESQLLKTLGPSKSSYLDPLAEGQKSYYYKVRSYDRAKPANVSPFSMEIRTGP